MELANIEKLLDKYLEAETSIKEEETLKMYFSQDDVASHLARIQSTFWLF